MVVEMVGETVSWSRLGIKLYLFMECQFSWRVISVHKTPHYFPATTRLSHRLQVCYWVLMLRRSTRTHFKQEFPPFLSSLRRLSGRGVRSVEMSWQILLIRRLWNVPRCLLVGLVTWEIVKLFSSTLKHRRFTRELSSATAQSTMAKQFRIFSIAPSLHTGSPGRIIQIKITNPLSRITQFVALSCP